MADSTKLAIWILVVLMVYQSGFLGGVTPVADKIPIVDHITEDVTVTLGAIDKYQTGTKRTTEYARVYVDGFDQGLVSLNSGTFEADVKDVVKIIYAENSSTYYTQHRIETIKDEGQAKYQGELITIDTSPTLTFYNDDSNPNTAQAIGAASTKIVEIKYQATTYKGVGNPQCLDHGKTPVTICIEYNTTAYTQVNMPVLDGAAIPTRIAAFGNASFGYKCFGGDGVYNGNEKRYKVSVTSGTPDPGESSGNYLYVYYEDCDFDINAKTGAEIWGTEDEDNNNLGSTTQIADIITFS